MYVCMKLCVCVYVCVHECMYACMYVCECLHVFVGSVCINMYVCMHVCINVCMDVCILLQPYRRVCFAFKCAALRIMQRFTRFSSPPLSTAVQSKLQHRFTQNSHTRDTRLCTYCLGVPQIHSGPCLAGSRRTASPCRSHRRPTDAINATNS